jgi:hypothetical protein
MCVMTVAMVMPSNDFGPCGIFTNVYVVITVTMAMLLKDFLPYGVIFMTVCVYYFRFSRHS